jgi:hypothetical protein
MTVAKVHCYRIDDRQKGSAKRIGFSGFVRKPENKRHIQKILEILSKKITYKIESIPLTTGTTFDRSVNRDGASKLMERGWERIKARPSLLLRGCWPTNSRLGNYELQVGVICVAGFFYVFYNGQRTTNPAFGRVVQLEVVVR